MIAERACEGLPAAHRIDSSVSAAWVIGHHVVEVIPAGLI
jgi:hypothetical protein